MVPTLGLLKNHTHKHGWFASHSNCFLRFQLKTRHRKM